MTYQILMVTGIAVSLYLWWRLARPDRRLLIIYVAALVGAFVGAKIVYIMAEGWMDWPQPDKWLRLATGKSILGALLGGYLGVELAKKALGYAGITGDWFALIAPVGIIIGRLGCLRHGCCLGQYWKQSWFTLNDADGMPRWPAVPVEILFNVAMLALFFWLRRKQKLSGQHFHLYLIAYGLFRFGHEFLREEPRWFGPISGYHVAALAVAAWGVAAFVKRQSCREFPG